MISQRRSKERRKRQAELQQQERLLKLQKLKEPGVPIGDFESEIVEIESLNTSEAEQVQEETVDLQPDEQVTHDCSTQTEAFDHLYQSVAPPSVTPLFHLISFVSIKYSVGVGGGGVLGFVFIDMCLFKEAPCFRKN